MAPPPAGSVPGGAGTRIQSCYVRELDLFRLDLSIRHRNPDDPGSSGELAECDTGSYSDHRYYRRCGIPEEKSESPGFIRYGGGNVPCAYADSKCNFFPESPNLKLAAIFLDKMPAGTIDRISVWEETIGYDRFIR
jgi:hypothetical protein